MPNLKRKSFRWVSVIAGILFISQGLDAQKAYPVEINALLSKIPIPQNSSACYAGCTKATDPSNGSVSITDEGPAFKQLEDQLEKISKAAMQDMSVAGNAPSVPSADQVEQMKQQAMQRAAEAQARAQGTNPQQAGHQQSNYPGMQSMDDPDLMRRIGQAQTAAGQINQLINELSMKYNKLDNSRINNVPMGPNCPEVQQGSYAGPTCDCQIKRATNYETQRVNARNEFMASATALLTEYLGKIKPLCATVDDALTRAKYGDAVSNPSFKQVVVVLQRQALGAVPALLGYAKQNWQDAANQYAGLVNARSGASVGCNKK